MTSPCTQQSVNDLELRRVPALEARVAELEERLAWLEGERAGPLAERAFREAYDAMIAENNRAIGEQWVIDHAQELGRGGMPL